MMISSCQLDKRLPATMVGRVEPRGADRSASEKAKRQLAPLASLDCSITEPITESHASTTDTPTLSGYFDCDQLSDMVDDSLFEITNAGCLSRSVFNGRGPMASPIEEGPTELCQVEAGDMAEEDGARTPTNEQPNGLLWIPELDPDASPAAAASSAQPNIKTTPYPMTTIAANHRSYDYSSTSTIPAQTRWATSQGQHRQRSRSARFSSSSTQGPRTTGGESNTSHDARVIHRPRRKTRSNPDVRDNPPIQVEQPEAENVCSECRRDRDLAAKKKEKKRFTFSLFNLFSIGASDGQLADDKRTQEGESCPHRQVSGSGDKKNAIQSADDKSKTHVRQRRSSRNSEANGSGSEIKSRDSIRVMNQRKQRAMRSSQTFSDSQKEPQTELLLDLSQRSFNRVQNGSSLKSSHSSYSVLRNGRLAGSTNSKSQRPTKSVKFTMHDRVMIVPSDPGSRAPGSANPPPAYLQPSAPIIKRPVSKSSSYSQTDSNKNLNELLAKYEVNNELITELSERLKLTETIASPLSTLDRAPVDDNSLVHSTAISDHNSNGTNNNSQTAGALCPKDDQAKVDNVNSSCDCDPNSIQTSNTLSEAEDAGFSKDWLDKQQKN